MPDKRTLAGAFVAAPLALGAVSACGSNAPSSTASCAVRFQFRDEIYTDVGNVKFDIDTRLGEGKVLSCDDNGGTNNPVDLGTMNAYAINGVNVVDAVAVGESANVAKFYVREGMSGKEVSALIGSVG